MTRFCSATWRSLSGRVSITVLLAALGVLVPAPVRAAELTKAQLDFFENKIRPILADQCYKCHSQQSDRIKGGLVVDSKDGLLKGGDTGPSLVPGKPDESLIIKAVRYTDPDLQMPPKNKKLSDAQIADLVTWVKMGAPDPRVGKPVVTASAGSKDSHWSFQPVKNPAVPSVSQPSWVANPIDAFVMAKLDSKAMKPQAPANKRTLIRRATFDLIGLPPTNKEVEDFLADNSPNAFAKVVDRLLESPHYGERWGRYWLDTARYSDTKGEVKKNREDARLPFAWTYRDYVIRAFNDDKPYDQFIVEQIAADRLPLGDDRSALAAMGFLTVGERFQNNVNDIINDRIDVVTKGFLGLTVTCARCHDHKFDPIPTQDYYSLYGIFSSSREPEEEPIISNMEKLEKQSSYNDYVFRSNALKEQLENYKTALKATRGNKGANVKATIKQLDKDIVTTEGKIAQLEMTHPAAPQRAMVLVDKERPADTPVFIRGEAGSRGQIVPRRFLQILSGPERKPFRDGSGRLELARAIASKDNPLTARVMINRLWQHHFGEGFVTTPDDFGNQSAPPSHPELLDYLANRFMQEGWSIKKMHRLIMLSNTYQQSSDNNDQYAQVDPYNRLLWRANVRRLEFEAVRDSILFLGSKLDPSMYGRPADLTTEPYSVRRSVYGYIDRGNLAEVFNQFDFANPEMTTGKRYDTIVPQQALYMMNNSLVVEAARHLVDRSDFRMLRDDVSKLNLLFQLVYQRPPTAKEIQLSQQFIAACPPLSTVERSAVKVQVNNPAAASTAKKGKRPGKNDNFIMVARHPLNAWEEFAHTLLLANEATFVN